MARELHLLSSMATRALLTDLIARWHAEGGAPVRVESVGGVEAARRVAAGEAVDVVLLSADAIERLAAANHVYAASAADIVRCDVAVAAPEGAARPAIGSEADLRAAVLAAPRVAYSTGPSGVALQQLFQRWDIVGMMPERFVQAPPGVPVGSLLARGEADLGFQQLSELIDVPGITVLGGMPPGLDIVTTFRAARGRASDPAVDVQPLFEFLRSSSTDAAKKRHGMQPVHG